MSSQSPVATALCSPGFGQPCNKPQLLMQKWTGKGSLECATLKSLHPATPFNITI